MRQHWEADELVEHWTLDGEHLGMLRNKTGPTRLGFAVLVKFFEQEGRFPAGPEDVPVEVVDFLARQLGLPFAAFGEYGWSGRSWKAHRAQIRARFGFRESTEADAEMLTAWLAETAWPQGLRRAQAEAALLERCRAERVEPPSAGRVTRIINSSGRRFDDGFAATTFARLGDSACDGLEKLLVGDSLLETEGRSVLAWLKADPGQVGLESVLDELGKLARIRSVGLSAGLFDGVSAKVVRAWRDRAATEAPSSLAAHPERVKYTLLGALCWSRQREVTDTLVDLLIAVVHKIGAKAERRVERELIADLRRVAGKANLLFRLAETALEHPDGIVSEVLFPVVGEQTMRDLVREFKSTGPIYKEHVQTYLRASYGRHYRQMLPKLLAGLTFRSSNTTHRPVLDALDLLARYVDRAERVFPDGEVVPLDGVVPPGLRPFVVQPDAKGKERVNRIAYEICVLQALRDRLRCKEIWVEGADRWRNPDEDLPADFDTHRPEHYARLGQSLDPAEFIDALRTQLTTGLDDLEAALAADPDGPVRITSRRGSGWITVTPLEALPEPANLTLLHRAVGARWPATSLLDMLKEAELRLGLTDCFETTATREMLDPPVVQRRVLLCLYAYGTNTGIHRIAAGDHGENERDLRYIARRYLTPANLRRAIALVVNATLAARHEQLWGHATTTASDSTKVGAWDHNLLTEWHARLRGPGVMIYWHVDKKSLCVYSQVKTCSSSEVAAMVEGLVRHGTDMAIEGNYVDTHGQSELGFAVTKLLGFRLMTRFKRIGAQRLYLPGPGTTGRWPTLTPVLTRPINWDLIADQYDQMIRYTSAIRLGTADTDAILRRFTRANIAHPTYRAFAELGKAVKTCFLTDYLRSETLRREVHGGLQVVENWNSANGFISFGNGGELATNRREDQELAVLCLHLLQASLVYINTLMIQQILDDPASTITLGPDDLRGLSPLLWSHVNPYGVFRLDLSQRLALTA